MSESAESAESQTVGAVLERDHHRIDEHFATFASALRAGTIDPAALAAGSGALRHHIYVEETYHFPALRQAGLLGPIMVMLREHGEIWDFLDALDAGVRDGLPAAELTTTWQGLEEIVAAHNMKEERIVYPSGDQMLSADDAAEVLSGLTAEQTPEGWVCEHAGRA
jgi:iron-sulfur cluster repair protein YtfE (RIC family)